MNSQFEPLEDMIEIKDSGNRRTFDTGVVRDMQTGKGRFDLLPMCVLMRLAKHYEKGAIKYEERNWEKGIPAHSFADSAMRHLVKYLDGYDDEDHLIAAIWNLAGLAWTEEKRPEMMDIPARQKNTKVDEYGKKWFRGICPYTEIECLKWTCEVCDVMKAERGYMDGEA